MRKNRNTNMALDSRSEGRMKGFSMLSVVVGVVVTLASVIAIVASLVITFVVILSLKFFGAGGIEVIGAFNTPYVVANTLTTLEINTRPIIEPVLASSVTNIDPGTTSKISAAIADVLDRYDFPYEVRLEGKLPTSACVRVFESNHKAVDISAACGTPVKAVCGGRLSVIQAGTGGDPVFGGTAFGGEDGIQIQHSNNCDVQLQGFKSYYGCIDILERRGRDVKRGEIIGYVSTCKPEKEQDCHLHFGITKGSLSESQDPHICDKVTAVIDKGAVLARKGKLEESEYTTEASIPLIFKDKSNKLVVMIGER